MFDKMGKPRKPVTVTSDTLYSMVQDCDPVQKYGDDLAIKTPIKESPHYKFAKLVLEQEDFEFIDTDYFKYGMDALKLLPDGFFGALDEAGILQRCLDFQDLILDIKENGIKFPVMIHKRDESGDCCIRDGHHRAAALIALGADSFRVDEHDDTWDDFRKMHRIKNFDHLLQNEINKGKKEKYQPLPKGFGKGLNLGRKCKDRLKMMKSVIEGPSTILDIGACLGYFTRELSRDGHTVHAIDIDPKYVDAMRRLEYDDPSGATYEHSDFLNVPDDKKYDYVICLAVLHHSLQTGRDYTIKGLEKLDKITNRGIFMEIGTDEEDWLEGKNINNTELIALFDEHTRFTDWTYLGRTRWNTRDVYYVS
jgi:hypothetical protein